jgi:PKD repeat protein
MHFKYLFLSFFCIVLLNSNDLLAQCPSANSCTPGSAPTSVFPFGMGIYNVTVGSGISGFVNTTSLGASEGYKDYSCSKQATIKENVATTISINTNPNSDENVRVWLDLNNNGTFDAATELVFSSNNARQHLGTITIPASATIVKNAVLRMRVSSDDNGSPIPTPCSTPKFGQVEDYSITVVSNTSKPAVDFSVNKPITCSPTVQFTDLTQNGATTYRWDFGDNTTSTAQNPSHTYAATGTYNVRLKVCNPNGCDSLTKPNFVTYHTNVPVAASCTPATVNYCCGYGITKVTFGSLVNFSQDGAAGYEDFTCTKSVTVTEGNSYAIALITSSTNQQDTWVYIDYNNNGTFETSELVFTKLNSTNPGGNVLIQGGVKNTPLRMRIISDFSGSTSDPCINRTGQAEDYTVIITPNTQKPATAFTSSYASPCDTLVQFTENSLNLPTSWLWDFGDGTAKSTLQNPLHTYSASGTYAVKLKTCNAFGCDSLIKSNYIIITKPCQQYCNPNSMNNNFYISKVAFNTINNTTTAAANGYANYTTVGTLITSVVKGTSYPITLNTNVGGMRNIAVWVDLNLDGDFIDSGEQVINTTSNNAVFTGTITIPTTARTGATRMRVMESASPMPPAPCQTNQRQTETEDYTLNMTTTSGLKDELNNQIKLYPNPNNGTFSLEIPGVFTQNCSLEIQDMVGKTVAKPQLKAVQSKNPLDLTSLPKGIYLLKIYNSEVSAIKKIIIE